MGDTRGNADRCENKEFAAKAIRKVMKTEGQKFDRAAQKKMLGAMEEWECRLRERDMENGSARCTDQ